MKKNCAAEFYKGYWRNDNLEGGERVGVTSPSDIKPSDAIEVPLPGESWNYS